MKGKHAAVAVAVTAVVAAVVVHNHKGGQHHKTAREMPAQSHKPVCGPPSPQFSKCNADIVVNGTGAPNASASPTTYAYGPTQFHMAYQLPCAPGGAVLATCGAPSTFGPQTIAIVDAYGSPTAESDLGTYDTHYGLPACTSANGCLRIVDENGGSALPTTVNGSWAIETSLDLQVAHAVCQTCKILLVEANSAGYTDLGTGVKTAANLGALAISNSYGGTESPNEVANFDPYYNQPGVAVVASTGDSGYGAQYPAVSPSVVSAGGTTLKTNTDNSYAAETAWNSSGSGCSTYESAPALQQQQTWYSLTGCAGKRATADVSADADPTTGAAVYDSTLYNNAGPGWYTMGGTSLSAPLVAAEFALAGGVPQGTSALAMIYGNMGSSNSHDVISGQNGLCPSSIMCISTASYDGPTGLGTLNGLAAISQAPPAVATSTAVPATNTAVAATSTPVPATSTAAAATSTSVPPTNTPPPAATSTATPKPTSTAAVAAPTATKTPAPTATSRKH